MNGIISHIKSFCNRHPVIANLLLMFIVTIIIIWGVLIFLDSWTNHGSNSVVPSIKGMSYQGAKLLLAEEDLTIEVSDSIYDRNRQPGTILESWPRAGAVVKQGRKIYVTVTAFSPKMVTIAMPVTGVSSRQAVSYLEALGINSIRLVNVPSQFSDLVENAHVDGKSLNVGTSLPVNANVTLEVGYVPVDTIASDALDLAVDQAIEDLESNDF